MVWALAGTDAADGLEGGEGDCEGGGGCAGGFEKAADEDWTQAWREGEGEEVACVGGDGGHEGRRTEW